MVHDVLPREPWLLEWRSSKSMIGLAVFMSTFTDGFLYGIVVAVLPFSLTARSGVSESDLPFWTSLSLAVFGTALVVGAPLAGWLIKRSKACQTPFIVGLGCAFGATLLFMLGTAPWIIVVARVFQGISAGIIYAAGLTLLVETADETDLGPMIGFGLSGMNFGVMISPTLGGIVYEKAGFYPVFIMGMTIVAVDLVGVLLIIDRKTAEGYQSQSIHGEPNTSSYESFPDRALTQQPRQISPGETDSSVTTSLLSPPNSIYLSPEEEVSWATITFGLLRNPRIMAALYGCALQSMLVSSMDAVLPIMVKSTFHWNSAATGAIFLNITIPSLAAPLLGLLVNQKGTRFTALCGLGLTAPTLALLALVQQNSIGHKVLICILLLIIGVGFNASLTALTTEIPLAIADLQEAQPEIYQGKDAIAQGYMLFDIMVGAGQMFGPLIAGLAFKNIGWAGCTLILGIIHLSGIIPVIKYIKSRRTML